MKSYIIKIQHPFAPLELDCFTLPELIILAPPPCCLKERYYRIVLNNVRVIFPQSGGYLYQDGSKNYSSIYIGMYVCLDLSTSTHTYHLHREGGLNRLYQVSSLLIPIATGCQTMNIINIPQYTSICPVIYSSYVKHDRFY
jgi:hypothetical protein